MITTQTVPVSPVQDFKAELDRIYNHVATRAHQLFIERGPIDGHDVQDWLTAEQELIERVSGEAWRNVGDDTIEVEFVLRAISPDQVSVYVTSTDVLITAPLNSGSRHLVGMVSLPHRVQTDDVYAEIVNGALSLTFGSENTEVESGEKQAVA